MRAVFVMIFAALSIVACATAPTTQELTAADIGGRPENAQQLVKEHFAKTLYDPYSAVYTFDYGPERGYWRGLTTTVGWVVCGSVNAKNRFGGYVGAKRFRVIIVKGRIDDSDAIIGDYVACQP